MKLLAKLTNKPAVPVTSWKDIKNDAFDMIELLNAGGFPGLWHDGFAISHAQVSDKPFNFFVTHKSWDNTLPRVICNARVIEGSEKGSFKEACLSFPHRQVIKTPRWWTVEVEFEVPPIDGIRSLLGLNRLVKQRATFTGLAAYLFQHEIDHAKGIDIYHK